MQVVFVILALGFVAGSTYFLIVSNRQKREITKDLERQAKGEIPNSILHVERSAPRLPSILEGMTPPPPDRALDGTPLPASTLEGLASWTVRQVTDVALPEPPPTTDGPSLFDAPAPPPAATERDAPPPPAPGSSLFDDPDTEPDPAGTRERQPVSELLAGVELPCGLVPLLAPGITALDPFDVPFVARSFDEGHVAREVRDELRRAGLTFRAVGPTEGVASRDGRHLRVIVHGEPRRSKGAEPAPYPHAPVDGVVVQFCSG